MGHTMRVGSEAANGVGHVSIRVAIATVEVTELVVSNVALWTVESSDMLTTTCHALPAEPLMELVMWTNAETAGSSLEIMT